MPECAPSPGAARPVGPGDEPTRILALDIGAGTADLFVYEEGLEPENSPRMVLPSPTVILARKVREAALQSTVLFLHGWTVGGGPLSRAVKEALARGVRVLAEEKAALTLRNDLEEVRRWGVELVPGPPPGFRGASVLLDELDLGPILRLLSDWGHPAEPLSAVAVAIQDHGAHAPGKSNRKARIAYMKERLREDPDPLSLAFPAHLVPERFPRMVSAAARLAEQLPGGTPAVIMDTAPAAVAGCLCDSRVAQVAEGDLLLVNAGNGHTLAVLLRGGRVCAVLEHHTKRLEPRAFASYLRCFCEGLASDDDPFMADGHGLFYLDEPPGWDSLDLVAVTGPHRERFSCLGEGLAPGRLHFPSPAGDMMMTGPMGLVRATLRLLKKGRFWEEEGAGS